MPKFSPLLATVKPLEPKWREEGREQRSWGCSFLLVQQVNGILWRSMARRGPHSNSGACREGYFHMQTLVQLVRCRIQTQSGDRTKWRARMVCRHFGAKYFQQACHAYKKELRVQRAVLAKK